MPDIKKLVFSSMTNPFYLPACQAKDANEGSLRAINVDGPVYLDLAGQGRGLNTLDFNRIHYTGIKTFL